jgi:SagB-type dehydrogenase family enzyme
VRLRRAAALVLHWHAGRLVVENYLTRKRATAAAPVLAVLERAASGATSAELARVVQGTPSQARRLVRALERATFLERVTSRHSLDGWVPWLPHAGLLHFGTKDEIYPSAAAAARAFHRRAREIRPPAPTKTYRSSSRRRLPAPAVLELSLSESLDERRTWRRFARDPLTLGQVATLAGLTWGVRRWARDDAGARVPLKTSPSGGAMHPGEVYVAAFRVKGLPRGLYHYDAAGHALTRVAGARAPFTPSRYLPSQPWYSGASALFLMTAVVGRERWKYDSPRAYRAMLLDAGHLCQTFCLVATALGLAPFCSMALADSVIEHDAGLDGIGEIALYAAGVGSRPHGPMDPRASPTP